MGKVEASPVESHNRTILIIDDNPANLSVVIEYLAGHGFQILAARDGETGLQIARQENPDLILLDVMLPGIDGFETCRRLKADKRTREIPVIFMTIVVKTEDKVRGFEAGGVDYITKPFQHEEVLARVTTHLALRAAHKQLAAQNTRLQQEMAERQQAEEALAHEQYLVQALMDNVPDYIYFKDRESRFIRTSKSHAQAFGLSDPAQAVGKTDFDFFTEEHARPAYEDEQQIIHTGQPIAKEERETWADRPDTWVLTIKLPLRDEANNIVGTFGISKDITERKRAEAALRESETRYHRLFEQTQATLAETQALYRVSRSVIALESLAEMLQTAVDAVADALPADRVTLITFDLEAQQVTHFVRGGLGADQVLRVPFDELWNGLVGWVLRESRPALSSKSSPDPRESLEVQRRRAETNCGDIIVVPLRHQDKTLGTLTAINLPDEREFMEHDVELMMAMASQAAMAIENARLYEELQLARAELERRVEERTAELVQANARLTEEIAERKRTEEALRKSEARYRSLFEDSPISLWEQDFSAVKRRIEALRRQGVTDWWAFFESHPEIVAECVELIQITDMNTASLKLYAAGSKAELLTGLKRLVPPEAYHVFQDELVWIAEGRTAFEWEGLNHTLAGERIHIRLHLSAASGYEDTLSKVLVSIEDITERKQAEEALRESEGRYRLLAENASDTIFTMDLDFHFTYISPSVTRMRGYPVEEAMAQTIVEVLTPASLEMAMNVFQEVLEIETRAPENLAQTRTLALEMNCKDGSTVWTESTFTSLRNVQDQPIGLLGIARDITDRKKAEKAREESEAHWRQLVEYQPTGSAIHCEGKIVYINKACMEIAGANSKEELIGKPLLDFVHPDSRPIVLKRVKHMLETGNYGEPTEEKFLRVNGETIDVEVTAIPVTYMGKPAIHTVFWDITERKRAEEALRRLNRELRAISNCNQTLLREVDEQSLLNNICRIVCDEAGYRLAWVGYAENDDAKTVRPVAWAGNEAGYLANANITWADTERGRGPTGTAIRSGESTCIQDFTTDPQAAPWRENALQRGYRSSISMPLKDESAKTFGALTIYSAEPNAFTPDEMRLLEELAGDLAFGITTLRTRTERKQAEAALRESEGRYRLLAENASDIIFTMDMDLHFTYISPSVTRILGYTIEEAMAHTIDQVLMPASLERIIQVFTEELAIEASESKQLWHARTLELEQICKDGSSIWTETTLAPLRDSESQAVGVVGITRDITERKRAEEELKRHRDHLEDLVKERTAELAAAKEQAEAANQAKSQFLANMSHELRTPLNAILGYAQLLQRDSMLTASHLTAVNTIERSGEHLLTLITDILDLSKIEAGKLDLSPGDLYLPSFLQEIASLVYLRANQKDIGFQYQPATALPLWVQADEKRLRQVLINLLSNAVKFTDQGEVTFHVNALEPAPISIDFQPAPTVCLRFEVIDTGVGIAADQLERIFLPFEQASNRPQYLEGTGLGLAISRQLVGAMGSDIHVTSEVGRGSTFWFDLVLPVIDRGPLNRPAHPPHPISYRGPRRKALIVDDQPDNRLFLVDLLHALGFDLREAENGQQAIEAACDWKPDLILMDMFMPVLSGFEATPRLRQLPELAATIIIGISAGVSEADTQHILQAGCHAVLPKPIDVNKLLVLLASHLKLEWTYTSITLPSPEMVESQRELIPPPPEELAIWYDLARQGNLRGIQVRAAQLPRLDSRYQPFADQVQHLARNFEDKALLALIKRYSDEHA